MTTPSQPATAIISGLAELAPAYDVIFCDVWGVVHNGKQHFAEACAALAQYRRERKGVVVLVTNAPRPNPSVRKQLDRLGVPREAFDDIVTSGDVTMALIARHGMAPLHHIGPERDNALFSILATQTGLNPPRVALKEASYVVCTGLFDDQNEKPEDYDLTLAAMRARDLEFICANPDHVVHVGEKLLYCSGAIASRYEQSGGKVIQAGKPHAPIYERAMEIARARLGRDFAKPGVLAIGDGMRTDVKGGVDFGLDVLFVAGGIHQAEVAGGADKFAAFLANAESRPKAALDSLRW